jgi:hypothetical protein
MTRSVADGINVHISRLIVLIQGLSVASIASLALRRQCRELPAVFLHQSAREDGRN